MLEEINKYQENLDKVMEQQQNDAEIKINRVQKELDLFRAQVKKERNEIDLSQYVKESDFQQQLDLLKSSKIGKGGESETVGPITIKQIEKQFN